MSSERLGILDARVPWSVLAGMGVTMLAVSVVCLVVSMTALSEAKSTGERSRQTLKEAQRICQGQLR